MKRLTSIHLHPPRNVSPTRRLNLPPAQNIWIEPPDQINDAVDEIELVVGSFGNDSMRRRPRSRGERVEGGEEDHSDVTSRDLAVVVKLSVALEAVEGSDDFVFFVVREEPVLADGCEDEDRSARETTRERNDERTNR